MQFVAVNPNQAYDYQLDHETGIPFRDDEPVFQLRPLTAAEEAQVKNLSDRGGSSDLLLLKLGLVGWRGLKNENGGDVPFPKGGGETSADLLPYGVRRAIAMRILLGKPQPTISPEPSDEQSPEQSGD